MRLIIVCIIHTISSKNRFEFNIKRINVRKKASRGESKVNKRNTHTNGIKRKSDKRKQH